MRCLHRDPALNAVCFPKPFSPPRASTHPPRTTRKHTHKRHKHTTHALLATPPSPQTESPDRFDAAVTLLRLLRPHPVASLTAEAASGVVWSLGALGKWLLDRNKPMSAELREEVGEGLAVVAWGSLVGWMGGWGRQS